MNITSEDEALLELFEITEIELIEISHHYD